MKEIEERKQIQYIFEEEVTKVSERNDRKVYVGKVVSDKMDKTITVLVGNLQNTQIIR